MPELDAVRGIAALTVVLLHFHDMWAPKDPAMLPPVWRIVLSLFRPLYAGSEAVFLFFVLSGLVLSLPYLLGRGQSYPVYLLRRVLRIYGPYLLALGIALVGASIWHGHSYHGEWAAGTWSRAISFRLVGQHIAFLGVYDWAQYDLVIWSLIQEMRVSIIFPLLVAIVIRIGGVPAFLLGLLLSYAACVIVPAYPDFSASYSLGIMLHIVACFIVGILLSSNLDRIAAWWKRSPSGIHWIVAVGSLGVYAYEKSITKRILPILFRGHSVSTSVHLILDSWLTLVGVCGFIVIALNAPIARQSLRRRVPQFLGKISYSLYLLHPVVLFALTFSCRNKISAWVQFPIYLSLSILVAWAFFLAVEEPFIRWSRSVR